MHISRRGLLLAGCALPLAACGIVSSQTTNGVTIITVNTAKAAAFAQALSNLGGDILAVPGVATILGPTFLLFQAANTDLAGIPAAINAYAGGAQTFSFDTTSAPAFINSLVADANTMMADAKQATNVPGGIVSTFQAIVTVAQATVALLTIAVAAPAPKPGQMSLAQAMAVARVALPE